MPYQNEAASINLNLRSSRSLPRQQLLRSLEQPRVSKEPARVGAENPVGFPARGS